MTRILQIDELEENANLSFWYFILRHSKCNVPIFLAMSKVDRTIIMVCG